MIVGVRLRGLGGLVRSVEWWWIGVWGAEVAISVRQAWSEDGDGGWRGDQATAVSDESNKPEQRARERARAKSHCGMLVVVNPASFVIMRR